MYVLGNNSNKTLLILPGAGGVGSLGIQIAKKVGRSIDHTDGSPSISPHYHTNYSLAYKVLGLTVIATASREESSDAAKVIFK